MTGTLCLAKSVSENPTKFVPHITQIKEFYEKEQDFRRKNFCQDDFQKIVTYNFFSKKISNDYIYEFWRQKLATTIKIQK